MTRSVIVSRDKKILRENVRYRLLRLGLSCNIPCLFCNVPWESYDYPLKISSERAKRQIDEMASADPEMRLSLTGGEPTLRKDLVDIVRHAASRGIKTIDLHTNAILLADMDLTRRLREAGLNKAFVSFHSHIEKVHDFLVGKTGSFRACVRGIQNLLEAGVEVTLNPVITTASYRWLTGYMDFVHSGFPQIRHISLSVVQPRERALKNKALLPRYGTIAPYVEKALARADQLGLVVNNPYCGLPLCIGGWHRRLERCVEYCEGELGRARDDGDKFHPQECSGCSLQARCGGVWREYAQIHPTSDLKPFAI